MLFCLQDFRKRPSCGATDNRLQMSLKRPTLPTRELDTDEPAFDCYVLGGDHLGTAIARRFRADGHAVTVVDDAAVPTDLASVRGDPADASTLADIDANAASVVVAATASDATNLLVAQLVRTHLDVPRVLVVANRPETVDVLAAAGHDPVCATTAIADAVARGT